MIRLKSNLLDLRLSILPLRRVEQKRLSHRLTISGEGNTPIHLFNLPNT
jgi:hypothetical protein